MTAKDEIRNRLSPGDNILIDLNAVYLGPYRLRYYETTLIGRTLDGQCVNITPTVARLLNLPIRRHLRPVSYLPGLEILDETPGGADFDGLVEELSYRVFGKANALSLEYDDSTALAPDILAD